MENHYNQIKELNKPKEDLETKTGNSKTSGIEKNHKKFKSSNTLQDNLIDGFFGLVFTGIGIAGYIYFNPPAKDSYLGQLADVAQKIYNSVGNFNINIG